MLNNLAERVANSRLHRHLLFLVLTALAIFFMGYRFGTFDQVFHIPYLKVTANPALYPKDPLINLHNQTYSYFWYGFLPFYELDLHLGFDEPYILQTAMFAAHVLCTYLTFWSVWVLSQALFEDSLTSLIATCSFFFPHVGLSGFTVIEFSVLNRTFVLPFVLLGLTLHVRKRTLPAFALLGLLANLHIITALFGMAMLMLDCLLNWRRIGLRQIVIGLALGVLMALPVLVLRAGGPGIDLHTDAAWLDLLIKTFLPHLFRLWGAPYVIILTLQGISVLIMYGIARRFAPSSQHGRTQDAFFLAPLMIVIVQSILMYFYPVNFLMRLQLMRAAVFLLIMAYMSFANYLANRHRGADWSVLTGTTIFSPLPMVVAIVWGVQHRLEGWPGRHGVVMASVLGIAGLVFIPIHPYWDTRVSGVDIYPERTDWYQAQRWARERTPLDALFITPPQIWSFGEPDWRVFSERSTVVTLADLLEVALFPDYRLTWQPRFEALAPGAIAKFDGFLYDDVRITAAAFYGLTTRQMENVANLYGASYLVVEKPHTYPFPLCYENPQYLIYALNAAAAKHAGCAAQ